jgi:hypothetical protein
MDLTFGPQGYNTGMRMWRLWKLQINWLKCVYLLLFFFSFIIFDCPSRPRSFEHGGLLRNLMLYYFSLDSHFLQTLHGFI